MTSSNMVTSLIESTIIRFLEQIDICKKKQTELEDEICLIETEINDDKNDILEIELGLLLVEYISLQKSLTTRLNNMCSSGDHQEISSTQERIVFRKERSAEVIKLFRNLMFPTNE